MKNFLLFTCCLLSFCISKAQIVFGNAFLKNPILEVGIAPNGTLGTTTYAPVGYHSIGVTLGVVADVQKDGWKISDTMEPAYLGDYVTPGSPIEIWSMKANGRNGAALNPGTSSSVFTGGLDGAIVGLSYASRVSYSVWQGRMDSLLITQNYSINEIGLKIGFKVKIKNISSKTINDIYYNRNVDPDNDADPFSSYYVPDYGFATFNKIEQQTPNPSHRSLVSAKGKYGKSYFGISAKDYRAKVYFIKDTLVPKYSIDTIYSGIVSGHVYDKVGDTSFKDVGMGIVFSLGNLNKGDSTEFEFEYVFEEEDNCNYLLYADDNFYKNGDTIYGCNGNIIKAEIYSTNARKFNWIPSSTLDTSSNPTLLFTIDNLNIYTAISEDSSKCISGFDTFKIVVKAINAPKPKIHQIGPSIWSDSTYVHYVWYKDGFPYPSSNTANFTAKYSGYYFVEVLDSNGCRMNSDTIYIDDATASINTLGGEINLTIAPNPCADKIQISYERPCNIKIYSVIGKLLINEKHSRIIDLSSFSDGMYLIEVINDDESWVVRKKIIKKSQ